MVVGTEHVYHAVVAARALVVVVGDVGREVGRATVGADQHAVLVVPGVGRAQEQRPVLLVALPALGEDLERGVDRAVPPVHGSVQRLLREPLVELRAEGLERRPLLGDHQRDALGGDLVDRAGGRVGDLRRDLGDVVALVAVLRWLLAARAGLQRRAEQLDLVAEVVDVVLAVDPVAVEGQQVGQRRPERRPAGPADVDRAGRVVGDELQVDRLGGLLGAGRATPGVVLARGQHVGQRAEQPAVGQRQIEEPRSRRLDPGQVVAEVLLQRDGQALGDHRRRGADDLRQQHRRVGRVVAVGGLLRTLQRRRGPRSLAAGDVEDRVVEDGAQAVQRGSGGRGVHGPTRYGARRPPALPMVARERPSATGSPASGGTAHRAGSGARGRAAPARSPAPAGAAG